MTTSEGNHSIDTGTRGDVRWSLIGNVVRIDTGPHFTTDDLVHAFREALESTLASGPLNVLFDNRGSKERASSQEIQQRAQLIARRRDVFGPKVAVLVSDALHYGLARMGGMYIEAHGLELRVFEDEREAFAWLRDPTPSESV